MDKAKPGKTTTAGTLANNGSSVSKGKNETSEKLPLAKPSTKAAPVDSARREVGYRLLSEAIKALTIVNGGAAVAALAFLGQLTQRYPLTSVMVRDAGFALAALAAGTMLPPAAALCFAYNAQRYRRYLMFAARGFLWGSVLTYFVGLYFGWKVLEPLGFFNVEVKRS
jgi:hypothetical protein